MILPFIKSVTAKYTFTHPVSAEDCEHVRAEIAAALPQGMGLQCECLNRDYEVIARVYNSLGTTIAEQRLPVSGYYPTR